jgi:hypothetical protein
MRQPLFDMTCSTTGGMPDKEKEPVQVASEQA